MESDSASLSLLRKKLLAFRKGSLTLAKPRE